MIVARFDTYKCDGKAVKLDSGFLRVPVFATRTGVFNYLRKDGTIRRELRHPDEVFNADSLNTLAGVPVTNRHPTVAVDSTNVRKFMVGTVSDKVGRQDNFVETSATIMDEKMIAEVEKRGLREVSCGYKCDVEEKTGVFEGLHYDAVQTNIRYNHLALVDKGRMGPEARLRMDANDAEMIEDGKGGPNHKDKPDNRGVRGMLITIDGVDYEVADVTAASAVKQALSKRDNALADGKTELAKVKADAKVESDKSDAKFDQMKEDHDKLKEDAENAPKVTELVKARVTLVSSATPHLDKEVVEKLDDMDDRAVKVAVIVARNDKFESEGKSDDYINARFDGIIETDVKPTDKKPATKLDKHLSNLDGARKDGEPKTADEMRADAMKSDENAWQQPLSSTTREVGSK